MSMLRCFVIVVLSAMVCSYCFAQSAQSAQSAQPEQNPLDAIDELLSEPPASSNRGFSWFTTVTGSHDSFSGWASVVDSSIRYDFINVFGVELGIPFFILHNEYQSTIPTRSQ